MIMKEISSLKTIYKKLYYDDNHNPIQPIFFYSTFKAMVLDAYLLITDILLFYFNVKICFTTSASNN